MDKKTTAEPKKTQKKPNSKVNDDPKVKEEEEPGRRRKNNHENHLDHQPLEIKSPTTRSTIQPETKPWTSLIIILITFILLSAISTHLRYDLPKPIGLPPTPAHLNRSATSDHLVFSEELANRYIHHLAGTIGYRIAGTEEMLESLEYLNSILQDLRSQAHSIGSNKRFEILTQTDDGAHLFEFMGKPVWKKYFQLSNLIVRLSDLSIPRSDQNAILVNAHVDSTLPSPGAADDVSGVAVMLEAIRIITQSPDWPLYNGIVFLFNGGEESLQDASHMFITKHPLKDIVRAVINLEACGTDGPEILFQATSKEMVEAYSKVPRPFGSVIASEVFGSGLIASDTDFRQFVQYGNLTGLDMAIMQNSYLYHTNQDIPSKIQPGVIQHMGENTMALLKHLTSSSTDLTNIKPASNTVFFSGLGGLIFIMYSKTAALRIYTTLSIIALTIASRNIKSQHYWVYLLGFLAVIGSLLGFLIASNLVAFITSIVLDKPLSWFRHECFPLLLFGPPSLAGGLIVQYLFSTLASSFDSLGPGHRHVLSHATLCGLMCFYGISSVVGAYLEVGAAYLPAVGLISTVSCLAFNDFVITPMTGKRGHLHLPMYLVGCVLPALLGVEGLLAFLDLFVPMTGRMGHEPHVDFIIASLVSGVGFNVVSISLPLAHRFSPRALLRFIWMILMITSLVGFWFTRPDWKVFDNDHPKRLSVLHVENLTDSTPTFELHIASLDRATGFEALAKEIINSVRLSDQPPAFNLINDDIPDWDIIFPVSQFLKSYRVPINLPDHQLLSTGKAGEPPTRYQSPWVNKFKVTSLFSKLDYVHQRRTLVLAIDHPGIIWTVIAFTADVVEWDLPSRPGRGKRRHHIKEVSGFGVDRWTLNVTIALDEQEFEQAMKNEQMAKGQRPSISKDDREDLTRLRMGQLKVEVSGLDQLGLYPARSKPKRSTEGRGENGTRGHPTSRLGWIGTGDGGPGFRLFENLVDRIPKWVDPFVLSGIFTTGFI